MKVAVETIDGTNVAAPFSLIKNFMVFEVSGKRKSKNQKEFDLKYHNKNDLKLVKNISHTNNIKKEIGDCSTIISHGLSKPLINNLRKSGVDVYITFRKRIDEAVEQYLKDKISRNFL